MADDDFFRVPFMDPVAFSLGPVDIFWYSLAYLGGIVFAWLVIRKIVTSSAMPSSQAITPNQIDDLIVYATLGMIVGGRLGHVIFYEPYLFRTPLEIINFWNGGLRGMSFHGGFIGATIAVYGFAWRRRISLLVLGDLACLVAPLGLGLGRLANFINGELWGRVTDLPWAVIFLYADGAPRHPSQLYEAALEGFLLLGLLWFLVYRGYLAKPGMISGVFLIGYTLARSFSELFREPEILSTALAPLTWGMILSLPMLIIGLALVWRARRAS